MDEDVEDFGVGFHDVLFHFAGDFVSGVDGDFGVDEEVEVDLDEISQPAGAEGVVGEGTGGGEDVFAEIVEGFRGGSGVEEIADAPPGHPDGFDAEIAAEGDAGEGVDDGEFFAAEHGDGDSDGGEDGGDAVGPVVPGVDHQHVGLDFAGDVAGPEVNPFFGGEGNECAEERGGGWGDGGFIAEGGDAVDDQDEAEKEDAGADADGDEGADFVVSVMVLFVGRAGGEIETGEDSDVGDEIGEAVEAVGDEDAGVCPEADGAFGDAECEVEP